MGNVANTKARAPSIGTQDCQTLADIHMRDLEVESPKEQIIACLHFIAIITCQNSNKNYCRGLYKQKLNL